MQFSLEKFIRLNRRLVSWLCLSGLLYVVRDLFALIFVTFLLIVITLPVIDYFNRATRFPRFAIITCVYLLLSAGLVGALWYAVPNITREATAVAQELPKYRDNLLKYWESLHGQYPQLAPIEGLISKQAEEFFEETTQAVGPYLVNNARIAFKAVTTLFFSVMFAYLVLLDLRRLTSELTRLRHSRLREFYEDTAEPVVQFFAVLARSFQAQAQVAILNTALTAVGFVLLGLPKLTLLLLVVFFFSFIPVVGVFISTTPAVLVALNSKGWEAGVLVVVIITIIHAFEAYLFNPLIYGNHLKLNPVLTLLILYVAHHFFGIWGAILGVPVATYFLYYVFAVPAKPASVETAQPEDKLEGAMP